MRAAVYYNNKDVRIEEFPEFQIQPDELLVKMEASGICGSDVMEWYRIKKAPLVLGHEMTGVIVEAGSQVKKYKAGQRVFVSHHVPCNTCRYCREGNHTVCQTLQTTNYSPGGFAEYIRVPKLNVENGVFVLPENISFEEGTFIEPLACVLRGQRMASVKPWQSVVIFGAGISGMLHLLACLSLGVKRVFIADINEYRLNRAKELGAYKVINADEDVSAQILKENDLRKADQVIVCTGAMPAFIKALQCVDRAGTLLFFAPTPPGEPLPLPVNDFWRQSIKVLHSYGASPEDTLEALHLLQRGRIPVKELITHRLRLSEAGQGFELVAQAKECIKVILLP